MRTLLFLLFLLLCASQTEAVYKCKYPDYPKDFKVQWIELKDWQKE